MSDSLSFPITPTINLTQIPANLQVPGNYVEIAADYTNIGLLPFPARALAIGQMRAASGGSTATAGQVYAIYRVDQGYALFGAASVLGDQCASWLLANPGIPLDAVGLLPPAGAGNALGSLTFGGTALVAGTQAIGVAGNRIAFSVAPTDTPANMAANFIAAVAASANAANIPVLFSANATVGQAAALAITQGGVGNEYDLRVNPATGDSSVPGITVVVAPMAGGTGTPDITPVLATIASTWYTDIFVAWQDTTTLGILANELANRYNAMETLDGQAYAVWKGTQGQIAAPAAAFDSQYVCALGITNPQQPSWVIGASIAGVAAAALTNDPARQLRGLVLPGILAPRLADQMYEPEQQALLVEGVATFQVAPGGIVCIQRLVTTYTKSTLGVPDTAWMDVMVPKVLTRIRWDWKNYCSLVYPRNKLADDTSLAAEYDAAVVTPRRLQGAWAARSKLYEKAGWIENAAVTAAASVFVRDPNNRNKVNAQLQVQIIGNLMVTAQQLLFDV